MLYIKRCRVRRRKRRNNIASVRYILRVNRAPFFACTKKLMDSFRLSLKPILLTRCGESEFETQGRIGGDSRLTPVGHLYAKALARGILQVGGESRGRLNRLDDTERRWKHESTFSE